MQYLKKKIRERILDAAVIEFCDIGYSEASIRNISQISGISLGNIYRYFANKEALYLAVVNPVLNAAEKRVDTLFGLGDENFEKFPVMIVDFLSEYRSQLRVVANGSAKHYERFTNSLISYVSENIQKSMSEKYPDVLKKIANPNFYDGVAAGFVHGLFYLLNEEDLTEEKKCEYIKEYQTFFFNKIDVRFE